MSSNFLIVPPKCPKCGKQMTFKPRIITCGFHKFLGVTDLICKCGYKSENIFNMQCEEDDWFDESEWKNDN
jgi:C4-type Zn-finger protein